MKYIYVLLTLQVLVSCERRAEIPCIPDNLSDYVMAFYPFTNQTLNDFSGNNHSLINIGSSVSVKDRKGNANCAYRFNGTPNQFLSRDGSFINDFKTKSFSISLWYQPIDGKNERQILFAKGEKGMTSCGRLLIEEWFIVLYDCERVIFYIDKKAQRDDFPILWQDPQVIEKCEEEVKLYDNKWHHLVVTYEKDKLGLYRNGVKSKNIIQNWNCNPISENQGDIFIGKDLFGDIDDIIIFEKALNDNEVKELFNMEPCCI
jgi:hypothetical protein